MSFGGGKSISKKKRNSRKPVFPLKKKRGKTPRKRLNVRKRKIGEGGKKKGGSLRSEKKKGKAQLGRGKYARRKGKRDCAGQGSGVWGGGLEEGGGINL